MGHEIVYCSKCQTRLLNSDFERGAAFRVVDGITSCAKCSADVLKLLPPDKLQGFLQQLANAKKNAAPPEKPSSIRIVAVKPGTSRARAPQKSLDMAAWIGAAAAAVLLVVLAVSASRGSPRPATLPDRPTAVVPKPAPADANPREAEDARRQKLSAEISSDRGALEKQVQEATGKEDLGAAIAALEAARTRHSTQEWIGFVDQRIRELREDAARRRRARFVRIEHPGPILSLAEVQVFSGAENVALKGKATQINTAIGAEASRAIDGNTEGEWTLNSVTHTLNGSLRWWEVDLGRTFVISRIVVWNRTDGNLQSRLKGYSVVLLDEARNPVDVRKPEGYPDPKTEHDFNAPAK